MHSAAHRHVRILAWGGVAGPAVFGVVVLVCAALRPDYSHLTNLISELGAIGTPYAALMNYGGFVPAGLMLAAFGFAVALGLPRHRLTMLAAVLVTLFGCGVAASGVISCDPGCPQSGASLENLVHDYIAPISFVSLITAAGILGIYFRRLPAWRHLSVYSLLTGGFALLCLIALANSLETRALTGFWQRLMLVALFLWCGIIGLHARSRVGILLLLVFATSAFGEPVAPMEVSVVERVNDTRRTRGVAPLRVHAPLTALAREHSCRMAREDGFSHNTGGTFRERVRAAGIPYRAIGENLAKILTDAEPVQRAIDAWMKSEGHRANLVSQEFTTTGVGVCRQGRTYYFTQIFMRP